MGWNLALINQGVDLRYPEVTKMKNRIGSAIVVVNLLLICGLFCIGCVPIDGYIAVDSGSVVMQPTFCLYRDPSFQQRLKIGSIIVRKKLSASDEKKRWKFDFPWKSEDFQTVWELKYKSSDNLIKGLFRQWLTAPVSCLTYGEVPLGYQEEVKALSLEPGEFYSVSVWRDRGIRAVGLKFIIRLDGNGAPEYLEYHQPHFLITHPDSPIHPRDDLKFY